MPRVSSHFSIQDARTSSPHIVQTTPATVTQDSNRTITADQIMTGLVIRSGATAGRTDTLPTAAQICEALQGVRANSAQQTWFEFSLRNTSGQTITLAAGTGGTTQGTLTTATVAEHKFRIVITNSTIGSEAYRLESVGTGAY